jgi:hypothetical protein
MEVFRILMELGRENNRQDSGRPSIWGGKKLVISGK